MKKMRIILSGYLLCSIIFLMICAICGIGEVGVIDYVFLCLMLVCVYTVELVDSILDYKHSRKEKDNGELQEDSRDNSDDTGRE